MSKKKLIAIVVAVVAVIIGGMVLLLSGSGSSSPFGSSSSPWGGTNPFGDSGGSLISGWWLLAAVLLVVGPLFVRKDKLKWGVGLLFAGWLAQFLSLGFHPPALAGIVLAILWVLAKSTKTKWDDKIVSSISGVCLLASPLFLILGSWNPLPGPSWWILELIWILLGAEAIRESSNLLGTRPALRKVLLAVGWSVLIMTG